VAEIKRIELLGFKQFDRLTVSCRDTNIFVGPNNAGKSSVLDALRICSDVIRFARRRKPELASLDSKGVFASHKLDRSLVSIPLENVTRNYRDEPARLLITLDNGNTLHIHVEPNGPVTSYLETNGNLPRSVKAFRDGFSLDIVVVPTLGPFEAEEEFVTDTTVRRNENTRLSHRNFRNILLRKQPEEFDDFKELVESTWSGVEIHPPEHNRTGGSVSMFFSEGRVDREINWAGFGFQVWLQLMLQMLRGSSTSVLVLDEPDIYLHADLQHKLLSLVKANFGQCFIATHSTEIVNEASPNDILTIKKGGRSAKRVTSDGAYSFLFSLLGSSENAEFARMARAKRIVFFEGKDRRIIRKLAGKLPGAKTLEDPDTIYTQIEGASQWRRVVDTDWTMQKIFGMEVKIAALFDRDYMAQDEVEEFINKVSSDRVICCVLRRKEIENYFLLEGALERSVISSLKKRDVQLSPERVTAKLASLTESYFGDVQAQFIAHALEAGRKKRSGEAPSTTIGRATKEFEKIWNDLGGRFEIIPGKRYFADVARWLQQEYGASLTLSQVGDAIRQHEIPNDLGDVFQQISAFFDAN
jgi:energy-coupling factor transporter ATP-binding protein EcfA2